MLLYGLGITSLAYQLGLSLEETKMIVNNYYEKFNGVQAWMNHVKEQVLIDGYVQLFSGRRWVLDIPSHAYKVINAIIQGSSADLTARAVTELNDYFKSTEHGRIVSIIHDEILMEIEEGTIACIGEVREIMEQKSLFGIPFSVDVAIGKSYGDF